MVALWKKLSALGVVGLTVAACTVSSTTTNTPDVDAGTGSDSGTHNDSGSGGDSGTKTDSGTGTDSGGTCSINITFDNGGTCDTCADSKCCAQINACFPDKQGGGDCDQLDTCITNCLQEAGTGDAGDVCVQDCFQAHPNSKATWGAYIQCLANSCKTECGG